MSNFMSYEKTLAEVRRLSEGATVLLPVRREPKRATERLQSWAWERVAKVARAASVAPEMYLGTLPADFERRGD